MAPCMRPAKLRCSASDMPPTTHPAVQASRTASCVSWRAVFRSSWTAVPRQTQSIGRWVLAGAEGWASGCQGPTAAACRPTACTRAFCRLAATTTKSQLWSSSLACLCQSVRQRAQPAAPRKNWANWLCAAPLPACCRPCSSGWRCTRPRRGCGRSMEVSGCWLMGLRVCLAARQTGPLLHACSSLRPADPACYDHQ